MYVSQSLDNIALRKEQLSIILPILNREANGSSAMLMGDFNFDPNLFVKKVRPFCRSHCL